MKNIFLKAIPGFLAVVLLLTLSFTIGPAKATEVKAAPVPVTIIYDLYATDGYIALADGTPLYIYGFVGGREGSPMTYQNSIVAPPGAAIPFALGAAANLGTTPVPVGGPVQAAERPLAGNAQFPAPLIYAAVGDTVIIKLKNLGVTNPKAPNDPHSIHLHGLDVDAANDGVPETSVGAVPANLLIPGAGNVVVYMFTAQKAGTYMYHCHQEADIHVQMGMYGALVIYEPGDLAYLNGGPGKGFGGTLWGWKYDKDVIMLLSEVDVRQHTSEQNPQKIGQGFNPINYQPQYWFINGLSFPNTVHAAPLLFPVLPAGQTWWGNWIAAHPNYDPEIVGSRALLTGADGNPGQRVLIRVINMGFETQPMHMHGFHGKILGSDQRAWDWANKSGVTQFGQGLEKNTLTIGSGETYEWLVDFSQQQVNSTYANKNVAGVDPADTQSKYGASNPVNPALGGANQPQSNKTANPAIPIPAPAVGQSYIGGPTVFGTTDGVINAANPAVVANQAQIFPFHNHDDYKATNNGVYPGGMFTVLVPLP